MGLIQSWFGLLPRLAKLKSGGCACVSLGGDPFNRSDRCPTSLSSWLSSKAMKDLNRPRTWGVKHGTKLFQLLPSTSGGDDAWRQCTCLILAPPRQSSYRCDCWALSNPFGDFGWRHHHQHGKTSEFCQVRQSKDQVL